MAIAPCFLSVEETCKQLSISNSFFYLLVKRGQLRTVKLGRRTLVPIGELERLSENKA
jgi:excisionase family DNA binding protein